MGVEMATFIFVVGCGIFLYILFCSSKDDTPRYNHNYFANERERYNSLKRIKTDQEERARRKQKRAERRSRREPLSSQSNIEEIDLSEESNCNPCRSVFVKPGLRRCMQCGQPREYGNYPGVAAAEWDLEEGRWRE